jgi:hypothetical protein
MPFGITIGPLFTKTDKAANERPWRNLELSRFFMKNSHDVWAQKVGVNRQTPI